MSQPEWSARDGVADYPAGLDVEWIAVDRNGHVGVFTTGGIGPIPNVYLTGSGWWDQIWDAIGSLPEVSEHDLLVTLPRPDDFIAFARRGLFAFDWADVHRTIGGATNRYELQARPRTPLAVESITWPEALLGSVERITNFALDFDDAMIDVMAALDCAADPAVAAVRGRRIRSDPGR
jgi:hypothetical protein